jgi:hypothetical protein
MRLSVVNLPRSEIDCWCNQAWLLKNSLHRSPQKLDRVRMPYKRFSLIAWTFSIPGLALISEISSFSTATGVYTN